jgi:hypothetical protein
MGGGWGDVRISTTLAAVEQRPKTNATATATAIMADSSMSVSLSSRSQPRQTISEPAAMWLCASSPQLGVSSSSGSGASCNAPPTARTASALRSLSRCSLAEHSARTSSVASTPRA